ncbi:hypothetical protein L198_01888 [Cryptococcus wingfieldii CBS 7118]|uniref:Xylose isomerase-like TIM barrel domain-containing protein n=1 Tax=Cryptococcus wingfieldii CBS 7118 TaxID=1295528 RepID=A0A1E3JWG2_9TREE|nr:hypothetical protein L198_01888 [Cryptococcus wingfieldii CBS 7118]ODO05199.1 hypothetical protein L198_01888 [Cryptococcus wingfieldii CBS 7118]
MPNDYSGLRWSVATASLSMNPIHDIYTKFDALQKAGFTYTEAERWLVLCSKLGVEQIQVGSNDYAEANAPDEKTADDLRWLAEYASKLSPPVKIAYESWCFSERVNTFEHTWKIVQIADHPNLGLCLDTAHPPLAPEYGWNPTTGEGWTAAISADSIGRVKAVPKGKDLSQTTTLSGLPLDDLYLLSEKNAGESAKDGNDMGHANALQTFKAVLDQGWSGIVMFEFFEVLRMSPADPNIPYKYANGAALSEKRLLEALQK